MSEKMIVDDELDLNNLTMLDFSGLDDFLKRKREGRTRTVNVSYDIGLKAVNESIYYARRVYGSQELVNRQYDKMMELFGCDDDVIAEAMMEQYGPKNPTVATMLVNDAIKRGDKFTLPDELQPMYDNFERSSK